MEITRIFGLFFGQLDLGASLLFGLPLLVIGLTLAGLARGDRARWLVARALRRHVADIDAPGPVTLTGTVRHTGTLALEEGAARAALEVAPELVLREGEVVTVYGEARSVGPAAAGYRDDARAFVIDLRSDEHFVLRGRANLDALVRNARMQRAGGGFVIAVSLVILVAGIVGELSRFTLEAGWRHSLSAAPSR
jgi:ketosteroid isomerase-like protein